MRRPLKTRLTILRSARIMFHGLVCKPAISVKVLCVVALVHVLLTLLPLRLSSAMDAVKPPVKTSEPTPPHTTSGTITLVPSNSSAANISNLTILQDIVARMNAEPVVHHVDWFGPLHKTDPVIVVQVHDRWHYLVHLLRALSQVDGIDRTLLIFSHDFYDAYLPALPTTVNFCKVMQIFLPYSSQLFPSQFPGQDPRDCPRNITQGEALERKCLNAEHPDVYKHYRESKFAQIKHHWWWKMNVVFDRLNVTKNHDGPVLLLEEDHYVSPDILNMSKLMLAQKYKLCKGVLCLCSVGNSKVDCSYKEEFKDKVEVRKWARSTNNLGHLFTRELWDAIKSCAHTFCTYDDYNWDLTLTALAGTCLPKGALQVSLRNSRIYHIGDCGVHTKAKSCNFALLKKAISIVQTARKNRFDVTNLRPIRPRACSIPNASGGWGDVRDHKMCLSMVERSHGGFPLSSRWKNSSDGGELRAAPYFGPAAANSAAVAAIGSVWGVVACTMLTGRN